MIFDLTFFFFFFFFFFIMCICLLRCYDGCVYCAEERCIDRL